MMIARVQLLGSWQFRLSLDGWTYEPHPDLEDLEGPPDSIFMERLRDSFSPEHHGGVLRAAMAAVSSMGGRVISHESEDVIEGDGETDSAMAGGMPT